MEISEEMREVRERAEIVEDSKKMEVFEDEDDTTHMIDEVVLLADYQFAVDTVKEVKDLTDCIISMIAEEIF